MRKALLILSVLMLTNCTQAQKIQLPAPDKSLPMTLMEAFQNRHSTWQHSDAPVSDQDLSTILWSAIGINRPEEGRITAPSAVNAQDIIVYVMRADGTYLYDNKENALVRVSKKDLRAAVCGNDPKPRTAPIMLLIVSDLNRFGGDSRFARDMAPLDAGYVSENICLACTALGLNTVPRMTMDRAVLQKELNLTDIQLPLLNHPISVAK